MAFTTNATIAAFGGRLLKLTHQSTTTSTPMNLNLFLPASAAPSRPAPLLVYLSGLTCTPDNVAEKGFLLAHAAPLGLALLFPDTSPRGTDLPGEHDGWDFGSAASFYIDAAAEPWRSHYRMETYLTDELPRLLFDAFAELDKTRVSIAGHSMGGHGALTLALKHPGMYKSVSAWAPIANPSRCPWGEKAFRGYLGDDREAWKKHDATELVKAWKDPILNCLIDIGTADDFYKQGQLLPENFEKAVKEAGIEGVKVRYQEGYDHSYFFISTFGEDHVKHAAKALGLL
ncbi:putative esterase domain-containing protein [Hirsutella rhossiliensis]|uniref:S-formylglutathione hydrolase n=1 Tax=Hirsutella rhossiliensis TaxID=111463 RepID=A0A9P8N522_9HYPO|nr:putative esterase domain-containing protein [Hirsutella rhossiliensis]KAH0965924.1 putative esterase domain-containing protein [Hirsutella rhossiliensis]